MTRIKLKTLLMAITTAMVLSLLLNVYTLSRLNEIEMNLASRTGHSGSDSIVLSQVGEMSRQLQALRDSQDWLSDVEFTALSADIRKEVSLEATLHFKELPTGAQVVFEVQPFDVKRNKALGEWQRSSGTRLDALTTKARFAVQPDKQYRYRVIVSGPLMTRESGLQLLSSLEYARSKVEVGVWKTGMAEKAHIFTCSAREQPFPSRVKEFRASSVTIQAVRGNDVLLTKELVQTANDPTFNLAEPVALPIPCEVFAVITYADGSILRFNTARVMSNGAVERIEH